jgi:hypothetical protein
MADPQNAIRVFFGDLEPHSVIADAEPQIAAAFQLLNLAFATRGVIDQSAATAL